MKAFQKGKLVLVALVLVLAGTSAVYAWGPCGGANKCAYSGKAAGPPGDKLVPELPELTDAQKEQLGALRQAFVLDTADLKGELFAKTQKLDVLLDAEKPDVKEIKALVKSISELNATLMEKEIDHKLKVKEIAPELGKAFGKGKKFQGRQWAMCGRQGKCNGPQGCGWR